MALSFDAPTPFASRHIGPDDEQIAHMLGAIREPSIAALVDRTVPSAIRLSRELDLPAPKTEHELLRTLEGLASRNDVWRSFLGMGYSDCITPPVILRNILENPAYYTPYTPYQAEVSQGRLEALLNFQTVVSDLTSLPIANASLLDEASAAAEAVHMMHALRGTESRRAVFVSQACHPQNVEVVRTRSRALGFDVVVGDPKSFQPSERFFAVLLQVPASDGGLDDVRPIAEQAHAQGALVAVACDLLALTIITPPGELGADIAVGSAGRFGVPLGYGGPHAAFFACTEACVRKLPGRIIGVTVDVHGHRALRMALQTREQHIRRERATSNVCTAQALLATVASMYAVYHGPEGLRAIASRVHALAATLATGLRKAGIRVAHDRFFDTLRVEGEPHRVAFWLDEARRFKMNLRPIDESSLGVSLDETTRPEDVDDLLTVFQGSGYGGYRCADLLGEASPALGGLRRTSPFLTAPVFHAHRTETKMLRYMRALELRDISLADGMIPLGSCTMKLNATAEMMPITWPSFARIHPFAPREQAAGYQAVIEQLGAMLAEITGYDAMSFQPNSGAQGELAGLLVIRRYHESRGEGHRTVCLIPASAHGTNPASAALAGMRVVVVACDEHGYVDLSDLEAKAKAHAPELAAIMITYPSTYGVFEEDIQLIASVVHACGGQVYLDGANLNALVGLCRPGDFGADVGHINLHKTFCIPHGGGGPGMGPIGVKAHLAPFLPSHPALPENGPTSSGAVSAAPWGSASILLISWSYISLMGAAGLRRASEIAILNANYVAERLHAHYPVCFRGKRGRVAHECILDTRPVKQSSGVEVDDIAKRLMDYGFHAPTMSFPVPGTLMVEPTESESQEELDRFCDAMIAIRAEIADIESGRASRDDNPVKLAPHTAAAVTAESWPHTYSREKAAFPTAWTREHKRWPFVGRIQNAVGDRNLICTCPPLESPFTTPKSR
jgi:glycine dehydrogenase